MYFEWVQKAVDKDRDVLKNVVGMKIGGGKWLAASNGHEFRVGLFKNDDVPASAWTVDSLLRTGIQHVVRSVDARFVEYVEIAALKKQIMNAMTDPETKVAQALAAAEIRVAEMKDQKAKEYATMNQVQRKTFRVELDSWKREVDICQTRKNAVNLKRVFARSGFRGTLHVSGRLLLGVLAVPGETVVEVWWSPNMTAPVLLVFEEAFAGIAPMRY
jgi:hypothetical protein